MRLSSFIIRGGALLALAALAGAAPSAAAAQPQAQAQAQAPSGEAPRFLLAVAGRAKPVEADVASVPMLLRRVTLAVQDAPVGDVLQSIGRQTGIKLVYASDTLPAGRRLTLKVENITLAAALTEVLLDSGLDVLVSTDRRLTLVPRQRAVTVAPTGAIVGRVTDAKTGVALAGATVVLEGGSRGTTTGSDGRYRIGEVAPGTYTARVRFIGYTPAAQSVTVAADQSVTADFGLAKSVQRLDEVVTTGTVVPTEVKALPTPISIVTAEDIQRENLQRVDQVFRGEVPGAVAFDVGAGGNELYSSVAVRGASALSGVPTIKTFIDGVEVADANYIAGIDPNNIDRIEITRGPQASTLYGAGALSGVMQIFTKQGQLGLGRPEVTAKLSAGGVSGFDGRKTAMQTDNAGGVVGGSATTSYNLSGSYRHVGEWLPVYDHTGWGLSTGGQTTQGPLTLSASARYADKEFDAPWDTRLSSFSVFSKPFYQTDQLRQQTYGVTGTLRATRNWQHTLTLGYDQSYYTYTQTQPRLTTPDDSFLVAFISHETKTSVLYHTDVNLRLGPSLGAVLTAGMNYDAFEYVYSYTSGATHVGGAFDGSASVLRSPWTNTGYFGQAQLNLGERLFLSGGLRAERSDNFGSAWSPRVGASYLLGVGPATVKLRASYGESIRAPTPDQREAIHASTYQYLANPTLAPERQRGVDGGLEIYLGRASLGLTYYNQRAIDLIQPITIPTPPGALVTYQNRNVSRVKNEGWEFEGHLPLGPVQLSGTYSIVSSTVLELPADYPPGSYQVGDPILRIPHTSAGATITYTPLSRTTLTATLTYFGHWTATDDVALYGSYFSGAPYRGSERAYWMQYPTVTKLAVGASQEVTKGVTAFARAENVGNNLRFEQTNLYIPTPRSVLIGANIRY